MLYYEGKHLPLSLCSHLHADVTKNIGYERKWFWATRLCVIAGIVSVCSYPDTLTRLCVTE